MKGFYYVLLAIAIIVGVAFTALIYITGKGDAMGGATAVRTTFKGKAGFDDFISRLTLILGASFMFLTLVLDFLSSKVFRGV